MTTRTPSPTAAERFDDLAGLAGGLVGMPILLIRAARHLTRGARILQAKPARRPNVTAPAERRAP